MANVQGTLLSTKESLFGVPLVWEGLGSGSSLKVKVGKEEYGDGCPRGKTTKVKRLSNVMGTSSGIRSATLAPRLKAGVVSGGCVSTHNLSEEGNLVYVRVDKVLMVHQTDSRTDSFFTSDSAIENCNRIFWVKSDENETSSVWCVGKEVGFSFLGCEGTILNSLLSLSNQGGVHTRKLRGDRRKFVDEDN